jgi:hypothetical protein
VNSTDPALLVEGGLSAKPALSGNDLGRSIQLKLHCKACVNGFSRYNIPIHDVSSQYVMKEICTKSVGK